MNRKFNAAFSLLAGVVISLTAFAQTTICNPVNLSYRVCLNAPSRRESADPTMVVFNGAYYFFASKSGGYFHSVNNSSEVS